MSKKIIFSIIGLIVIIGVVMGIFYVIKPPQKTDNGFQPSSQRESNKKEPSQNTQSSDGEMLSNNQCQGEGKPKLTNLPMNDTDFSYIVPYGLTAQGHVTPIDHQYFSPTVFRSKRDAYPVFAMADSKLVGVEKRDQPDNDFEYRLVFSVSCKLFYYYDLVTGLTPEISSKLNNNRLQKAIDVTAGQQIGSIGGRTLDFAVWDMDVNLTGFVVPEHYRGEIWKAHIADPLDYYTDELKQKVLSKYIRTKEPVSGKIDYDIDGKLVGNWFVQGSGGYSGNDNNHQDYYKNHLSIAYDMYDPTSIVFSVGDYGGQPMQFGVKGNAPDPKDVSVATGLVKYEFVEQDWAEAQTGKPWDRESFVKGLVAKNNDGHVIGVALVKMLENRQVQVEVFPGKTASQVDGFSANAKVYER